MRIRVTCKSVQIIGYGSFVRGDVVEGKPRDLNPLLDGGFAVLADVPEEMAEVKFASARAADLVDSNKIDLAGLEPGGGSGRDGAYTVADLEALHS
jgi:hypothetical protein